MIADKKQFITGTFLLIAFCAVLVVIFLPLFNGQNALNYMDSLFNSISKGSAYYIDDLREDAKEMAGKEVALTLAMADEAQAGEVAPLFTENGAQVDTSGTELKVTGDLGLILAGCLTDADLMFSNNGTPLKEKYGYGEKKVMFNWWSACKEMDKALKRQEKFDESKILTTVMKKGVECSYNYYGIEAQKISENFMVVLIALVFYVIYTLWYGFAIMFMFEGWGLKLGGH